MGYAMISYHLPVSSLVVIEVYTSVGGEVITLVEETQETGFHFVEWDGRDAAGNPMPHGWYIYRFDLNAHPQVRLIPLVPEKDPLAET